MSTLDIRNMDGDGQVIFIEVKATIQSNSAEPIEISASEIQGAARATGSTESSTLEPAHPASLDSAIRVSVGCGWCFHPSERSQNGVRGDG